MKPDKKIRRMSIVPTVILIGISMLSLIHRHDVDDSKLIELAKQYPQICHFNNGEGTLIAPQWVLTAGHVGELYENETDQKKLTISCLGQNYLIDKVFVHKEYNGEGRGNLENDIALVKLKTPVQNVIPAKLYSARDEKGKQITLVGSGYTGTGLTGPQKEKWDRITRAVTNKIDGTEGRYIFFRFDAPHSKNATELEGISGPGDSGGPAFVKVNKEIVIVGISSHQKIMIEVDDQGNKTGEEGQYGVVEFYTRVSDYSNWIKEVMTSK